VATGFGGGEALSAVERAWVRLDGASSYLLSLALGVCAGWGLCDLADIGRYLAPRSFEILGATFVASVLAQKIASSVLLGFTLQTIVGITGQQREPSLLGGMLSWVAMLGLIVGVGFVAFEFFASWVSKPLVLASGVSVAGFIALVTASFVTRAEWLRHRLGWRRPVMVAAPPVAIGALAFGVFGIPEQQPIACTIFLMLGTFCAILLAARFWIAFVGSPRNYVIEYGPSVSRTTASVLVLGVPLIVLISFFSVQMQSITGGPAAFWSYATLALVIVGGLTVAFRSFNQRDSQSWAPVWRRVQRMGTGPLARELMKEAGLVRRRGRFWRNVGRGLNRRFANFIRKRVARPLQELIGGAAFLFSVIVSALQMFLSLIDYWLAYVIAPLLGAALRGRRRRYGALIVFLAITGVAAWQGTGAVALAALIMVSIGAVAIARRWSWIEADRRRYLDVNDDRATARNGIRIGFEQDLGDEAIVCFLAAFSLHLPLALGAMNQDWRLFEFAGGNEPGFFNWLSFVGGELANAVPFVDWAETYGDHGERVFQPASEAGRHVLFGMRISIDLLLLATILQVFSTSQTLTRQRERFEDPGDPLARLDPFEEREVFGYRPDEWDMVRRLRFYDEARMARLLRTPQDRASAIGAARVAGYGLAAVALRELIYPVTVPQQQKGEINSLSAMLRDEMRQAALQGLKRRLAMSRGARSGLARYQVIQAELSVSTASREYRLPRVDQATRTRRSNLQREFEYMAHEREAEIIVRQIADGAPQVAKDASERLKVLARGDQDLLVNLMFSADEDLAAGAVRAIVKVPPDRGAKLSELMRSSKRESVLIAAATAAANPRFAAYDGLAHLIRTGSARVQLTAIRAAEQNMLDRELAPDELPADLIDALESAAFRLRVDAIFDDERALAARKALVRVNPKKYRGGVMVRAYGMTQQRLDAE